MPKTKQKSFSVTKRDLEMLKEILAIGNFTSRSDLLRHCIRQAHIKYFPYYKKKEMIKDQDKAEIEKIKKLPLEEYVKKVLQGDLKTEPGFCLIIHRDNPLHKLSIAVGNVKNFTSRNQAWESAGYPPEND